MKSIDKSIDSQRDSSTTSNPATTEPQLPLWGRMETLWLLIGPLCTLIYALCQSLAPNDLWYHVRAGELIDRFGTIPTQNLMSFAVPLDTPFYYQSWLAEWLLFKTLQLGGLSGLQLLRAFCLTAGVTLLAIATFRFVLRHQNSHSEDRLRAARTTAMATQWGFLMLSNNLDLRPQTFSVLLCGAWIFALLEFDGAIQNPRNRLRWGLALCFLALIWANTHGAFILAVLSLAGLTVGKWLTKRSETKSFALLTLLCLLSGLINPRGAELYRYVLLLSNNEIGQKYIQEWGAPDLSEWHSWLFFLSIPVCGLMAIFAFKNRKPQFFSLTPYLMVLGIVFVMGMRDVRSIIWFALFFTPVFAVTLARLFKREEQTSTDVVAAPHNPVARGAAVMNLVLLILLIALPIPLFPGIKSTLPWPDEFRKRFAPTPQRLFPGDPPLLLDQTTPVEAVEFWATHPPESRVFTDMVCGSYMTWATHPRIKPLCEPRIELFPVSFWEEYVRLSNGKGDVEAAMKKWGCEQALLDRVTQKPLAQQLKKQGWQQVVSRGTTLLLKKSE